MKKRSLWLRTGVAFALMLTLGATPGGRVGPAVPPTAPASPSLPTPAQGVPASSPTAPHAGSTAPWLLVSDVHFNPFDDAALVDALDRAPVMHWRGIFERGGAATSTFFTDTNYALLRSALKAMQTKAPAPPVVAVAGDFLAHEFPAQYARAEPGRTQADYERFVDKTIAFLASQFDAAFPSAQFVITLGNNDGYCGDYRSTPSSPFLQHMADAWQPLVDRGGAAPDFRRDFPAAGYYTATLPAAGTARAQAVVLNSVVWSAKYGNACGDTGSDPGSAELDWLIRTLQPSPGAPLARRTHSAELRSIFVAARGPAGAVHAACVRRAFDGRRVGRRRARRDVPARTRPSRDLPDRRPAGRIRGACAHRAVDQPRARQ